MRRTPVLIALAVFVVAMIVYLTRDADDTIDIDIDALSRRQALREVELFAKQEDEKTNLATLALKGLGQAVPKHLVSKIDRSASYWFVGKEGIESGVQVPFEPGKLPHPVSTADPLSPNPGFLGADACRSCHEEKHESFIKTAHHRTTRLAIAETISGSFEPGRNQLRTSDPEVFFTMVKRGNDLFQRVSFYDWQFEVPFQIIIGSSKMAESYLYWHGDRLFQMNCSYFSEPDGWSNSPGYIDSDAIYARPIRPGCLECHVTYADLRQYPNHFTPSSMILGISCERCHGPGKEHVNFHLANPNDQNARHITLPSKLSRAAQMELCGQCHTGQKEPIHEAGFQFRPGDSLLDHYRPIEGHDESPNSVHTSDQLDRLAMSECFKQSEMACVECHDPHKNERGQDALFSQRCLKCHQSEHCGMSEELGDRLAENCIDCHMPKRPTANLRVETAAGDVFPPLRDHYIRVDPQATKKYLNAIGQ